MLNLLPPANKDKYRVYSFSYVLSLIYIVITLTIFLSGAVLATVNFTKRTNLNGKEERLNQLASERINSVKIADKAAFIEDRIKNKASYQDGVDWNKVLEAIASDTPTNVNLSAIKVSTDAAQKFLVSLQGKASDRRAIVLYQSKLSTNSLFSNPAIQSITQSADINKTEFDFSLSLTVTTNVVKK